MANGVVAASCSPYSLRVTAADVASMAAAADARALEWVRVAARAFPLLGTVSKAKRARKSGELTLNGSSLVPTNVAAAAGDEIVYAPRAVICSSIYAARDQASRIESTNERSGRDRGEDETDPDKESDDNDAEVRRWAAVCERQGLRRVFENDEMALIVKPVHRLDARVGGLLLVAKTRRAEVSLSAQFERHVIVKRYRAILVGRADCLTSHPSVSQLGCSSSNTETETNRLGVAIPTELVELQQQLEQDQQVQGMKVLLVRDEIEGRLCVTAIRVVSLTRSARYEWISTVDLWPLTGRRHQLRVHMACLGLPIVGDDLYHESAGPTLPPVVRGLGLFLFAVGIAFNDDFGSRSSSNSLSTEGDDDNVGNRRRFEIDEPPKFARFRHFCELNWQKKQQKQEEKGVISSSNGDSNRKQEAQTDD